MSPASPVHPPSSASALRQRRDKAEVGQPLHEPLELLHVEEVLGAARAVVVDGRKPVARLLERAQQRQDGCHPGAPADEQQAPRRGRPQCEHAVRPGQLELVPDLDLAAVKQAGEMAVRVDLDHELELVGGGRRVGHRERAVLLPAGDLDIDVLTRLEAEPARVEERHAQQADVVREPLDCLHPHAGRLKRDPAPKDLLVEVEQLDLEIGLGVRPAEQGVALRLLEVGQREGRVAVEVDLPVEQEGLAGCALPLLAAVHEHQALAECGVEDGLVLVGLHLDANRLETDGELLSHGRSRLGPRGSAARAERRCHS